MNMTYAIRTAVIAVTLACPAIALASDKAPTMAGTLKLEQPWIRATPPRAPGGAYLTITNTGSEADRLVAVKTPISGRAEIHEMKMDGGVMSMRPLGDGLPIPAGETTELKPGGYHLMLMKLERPISEGEAVPITLSFEKAGEVTLDFMAAPIGAKEPPAAVSGSGS